MTSYRVGVNESLISPTRMHSVEALAKQDALRTSFLNVRRTQHDPLPANSDQASAAYNAPYSLPISTRGLAVETNGKQMTALMKRFRPTEEACERLAGSDLPVHALDDLPEDMSELVICPNWSSEHVIYRCMSPLLEGLRDRGVPLMRPFDEQSVLQPVALDWFDQTVDVPNSSSFVLTHIGALCHALRQRNLDLVFYPEISPANLTYWLATQRFARVQATGYGFPVTTGMRSMDYFVGGADVELDSAGAHYTEQLVLLPGLGVSTTEPPLPTAVRERDTSDGQLRQRARGVDHRPVQDRTRSEQGPWRGLDDLELATLEWVDWFNHRRLFHELGRVPPVEFEDLYYRQTKPGHQANTQTTTPA